MKTSGPCYWVEYRLALILVPVSSTLLAYEVLHPYSIVTLRYMGLKLWRGRLEKMAIQWWVSVKLTSEDNTLVQCGRKHSYFRHCRIHTRRVRRQ